MKRKRKQEQLNGWDAYESLAEMLINQIANEHGFSRTYKYDGRNWHEILAAREDCCIECCQKMMNGYFNRLRARFKDGNLEHLRAIGNELLTN